MMRALLETPIDIVHQHGLWLYPSIATSRWRRRRRRPVVISTQGMLEPWAVRNSWAKKAIAGAMFERSNLRQAACLHCSQAEVEGVRGFGLRNPIAVIPNGADLPALNVVLPRPEWLPDDGRRTLLFLGRLHPKKGIRETLDAWLQVKAMAPDVGREWRLVIAGWDEGGYGEALFAHAQAQGLSDDVIFPGPIFGKQKEAALAYADAFILVSHSEGLPMAVLEAWSHTLPVFMTRECNLVEGFAAGAAIEVTSDPRELALTLVRSLVSSDLGLIGQRGRDLVERRFAWEAVVRELLAVYLWLARGSERPSCVIIC
jgi:poly(glycerol-phosphate) alpha-glucosyltransferase